MGILRKLGNGWMRIALVVGNFNSRVVLTVLYVVVVLPFGLILRLFGDPLKIKGKRSTTWSRIDQPTRSLTDGQKQF